MIFVDIWKIDSFVEEISSMLEHDSIKQFFAVGDIAEKNAAKKEPDSFIERWQKVGAGDLQEILEDCMSLLYFIFHFSKTSFRD